MEAVFDRRGAVTGWLEGEILYDKFGRPKAVIVESSVFNYLAAYLGEFESGYFWDKAGRAIAWIESAIGEPRRPLPDKSVTPPYPALEPDRPRFPAPPSPAKRKSDWSPLSWDKYLLGLGSEVNR